MRNADLLCISKVIIVKLQESKENKWNFVSQFSFCNALNLENFFMIFVVFTVLVYKVLGLRKQTMVKKNAGPSE